MRLVFCQSIVTRLTIGLATVGVIASAGMGVLGDMAEQGLFVAIVTLAGLLMVRRWFTGPLRQVLAALSAQRGPEPFYELARKSSGEFAQLSGAIGGMLCRLEHTTSQLRQREKAFKNLYQFAPAAMLSIEPAGKIIHANRRAAELFDRADDCELIGQTLLDFIEPHDQPRLHQAIERLGRQPLTHFEMRMVVHERVIDVHVECSGVRNEDAVVTSVRLALLNVSPIKLLERQLVEKGRLLNLIIDHMSDAILLVDGDNRICAHNHQLTLLLQRRGESLVGTHYEAPRFWQALGVSDHEAFLAGLCRIEADHGQRAQQLAQTRVGTFLFQGIDVEDDAGESVGRLWVVQDITSQEHTKRLIHQQDSQLEALKRLGNALAGVSSVDELLTRAGQVMYELLQVEVVALALRDSKHPSRGIHLLHQGLGEYALEPCRQVIDAVQCHLMPQVMNAQQVTYWPDLPQSPAWSKPLQQANITSLAGTSMLCGSDAHGIIWIARRGERRLERHHLYLLEAMAPMIAARIEFARLRQAMHSLCLSDQTTDLPNEDRFVTQARHQENRPGSEWAVVVIDLDHFAAHNQQLGHREADRLLRDVAGTLQRCCRRSNMVARLDGPRFGILCPQSSARYAEELASRLRQAIQASPYVATTGSTHHVTVTVGVACSCEDGPSAVRLLSAAALRVDLGKEAGRNRVMTRRTPLTRLAS